MQPFEKKRQKTINCIRGETGWIGQTPRDKELIFLLFRKERILYGQEEAAQENAYYSNKKIVFYGL